MMAPIIRRAGMYKLAVFILVVFIHNALRAVHDMSAVSGNDFLSTMFRAHVGNRGVYNACRSFDENDFGHVEGALRNDYVPPTLRVLQTWTSQKPAPPSITLVTQLTFSRLSMLHDTCRRWPGKIAAVVCVPFVEGLGAVGTVGSARNGVEHNGDSEDELLLKMTNFVSGLHLFSSGCSLDLELVVHDIADRSAPGLSLYPVNAARNRALMLAKTAAVLLLDVDFLPSESLVNLLTDPNLSDMMEEKRAYVVPAFGHADYIPLPSGTDLRQHDVHVLLGSKAAVVDAYLNRRMPSFYEVENPGDHGPTNYSQWALADRPYDIEYEDGYEPYILIAKKYVPWYDERFMGYYRNKVSHLEYTYSIGIQFTVHPEAYVIHRAHAPSPSMLVEGRIGSGHLRRMVHLHNSVRRALSEGVYSPVSTLCTSLTIKSNFAPRTPIKPPAGKWRRQVQDSNDGPCLLSHGLLQQQARFYVDVLRVDVQLVKQTALLHRALVDPSILGLADLEPYAMTSLLFDRVPATCTDSLHYVDISASIAPRVLDILRHRQNIQVFVAAYANDACNEVREQVINAEFATRLHCGPLPTLARDAFRNVLVLKARASELVQEGSAMLVAHTAAFFLMRVSTSSLREQGTDELNVLESLYDAGYVCTHSTWRLDNCDATPGQSIINPPIFSTMWIPFDEFSLALGYCAEPGCAWSTHLLCF